MNQPKKAICIITKNIDIYLLDFYNKLKFYDVFFMIDDNTNSSSIPLFKIKYKNIHFILLDNSYVEKSEYINSSSIYLHFNKIIAWDKALLFFYEIREKYQYVWFLENDVWFYDENTLLRIDSQYPNSDLLTNQYNRKGSSDTWPWNSIELKPDYEYYKCMICSSRFSQKMLESINNYVLEFHTLFFIETMFPTLALKNNLLYNCPEELHTISYNEKFTYHHYNKYQMFHPLKNSKEHSIIRSYIQEKEEKQVKKNKITLGKKVKMYIL